MHAKDHDALHIVIQDVILRDYPIGSHVAPGRVTIFTAKHGKDSLHQALSEMSERLNGRRFILFCSLQVAALIRRSFPALSPGLILNLDFLSWHKYTPLIPKGMLLNERYIMMPYGMLYRNEDILRETFGQRIFIRPDSAAKTFPGIPVSLIDLDKEIFSLNQTYNIDRSDLVVVSDFVELPKYEYRFWFIEGKALSPAGYCHDGSASDAPPCPEDVAILAQFLATHFEMIDNALVADFVMTNHGPKLVEMNAISTSGFYPQMQFKEVIGALEDLMS